MMMTRFCALAGATMWRHNPRPRIFPREKIKVVSPQSLHRSFFLLKKEKCEVDTINVSSFYLSTKLTFSKTQDETNCNFLEDFDTPWTVKIQNCLVHLKSYWTKFKLESLEPHLFPSSKKKCKLSWISGLLLPLLYCCSSPPCVRCQACKLWLVVIFMPCIGILQGWSGTLWYHKAPHVWSWAAAWRVVNEGWTTDPGNKGRLQRTCSPFQSLSLLCNCGPLWKFALKRHDNKRKIWIELASVKPIPKDMQPWGGIILLQLCQND